MGREIRRVPEGWEHPRNEKGHYVPLLDRDYPTEAAEWLANANFWAKGEHPSQILNPDSASKYPYYWEWEFPPDKECMRPAWKPEEMTHYQVYEDVSEGTPISPVFASLAEVEAWAVSQGYSPEAAAAFIRLGSVPSMVVVGRRIYSDIEAAAIIEGER